MTEKVEWQNVTHYVRVPAAVIDMWDINMGITVVSNRHWFVQDLPVSASRFLSLSNQYSCVLLVPSKHQDFGTKTFHFESAVKTTLV